LGVMNYALPYILISHLNVHYGADMEKGRKREIAFQWRVCKPKF
jgi:hypothetical protein